MSAQPRRCAGAAARRALRWRYICVCRWLVLGDEAADASYIPSCTCTTGCGVACGHGRASDRGTPGAAAETAGWPARPRAAIVVLPGYLSWHGHREFDVRAGLARLELVGRGQ